MYEQKLLEIVKQLKEKGVKGIKFTLDETKFFTAEEKAKDMVDALQAYLDGRWKPFKFNDSQRKDIIYY